MNNNNEARNFIQVVPTAVPKGKVILAEFGIIDTTSNYASEVLVQVRDVLSQLEITDYELMSGKKLGLEWRDTATSKKIPNSDLLAESCSVVVIPMDNSSNIVTPSLEAPSSNSRSVTFHNKIGKFT